MSHAPRTRLPLQIGIQALYSLAVASAMLIPSTIALLATLFLLVLKGGFIIALLVSQGWVVALGIVAGEVILILRGINHLRLVLRTRAADVFFDDDGLAIDGGRMHGTAIRWTECREIREEAFDRDEIARTRAVVVRTDGSTVTLAEAAEETELASLRALVESVRARLQPDAIPDVPVEEPPDLLRCPACAAPTSPVDAAETTCAFCAAAVPIPAALRDKLRATEEVLGTSKVSAPLLAKLLAQPSAHRAMVLSIIAGLPIAAMWLLAVGFGFVLYRHHGLLARNVLLLSATAMVTIVAVYLLLRFWFVNRKALAVIALHFGAFPPAKPGAPWTCRGCSAPLPAARSGLLARCPYCGADNVQGIDLRPRAAGARRERVTLEATFKSREQERRTYARRAAVALAVLPLSIAGFVIAAEPMTRETKLLVACDRGALASCRELGHYYLEVPTYDGDGARQAFDRACTRGDQDACMDLGDLLGRGDERDLARGLDLLTKGCDRGHAGSCGKLGAVLHGRKPAGTWPAPPTLFRRACDGHDVFGCTALAELLLPGEGVPKDEAKAVALFQQSCAAHDVAACSDLAQLFFTGRAVAQDVPRAIAMFREGCRGTYPASYQDCANLAIAYHEGRGVPKDAMAAWDLDRRACEYGNIAGACARIGRSQQRRGELQAAQEHLSTACGLGDGDACLDLADVMKTRSDRKGAFAVLGRACKELHVGAACARAGVWAKRGEHGAAADPAQAATLYAAGCAADDADACNLGGQLAFANADYATALPLLVRACDRGATSGCNYLGKAQQDGLGMPADEAKAIATFQRACAMPPDADGKHGAQGYGCAGAGFLVRKSDEARGVALLKQACTWGNQEACDAIR